MVTEGRVWKPNHQNLWQAGALTPAMSLILQACVCANFNILVSGTANSGTADLIEALCACIDGKMEPPPKSALRSSRIIDACMNLDNAKLLQVMNNSFPGSILTICADAPASAVTQLDSLVHAADPLLSELAVKELICDAIRLVIQVQRMSDGIWRVMHMSELIGKPYFRNQYQQCDIFFFDQETRTHIGSGLPPAFLDQLEQACIPFSLTWLS